MPVLPAASVALTWIVCRPSASSGASQLGVPSIVHSTCAPGSVEYANAGVESLLGSGGTRRASRWARRCRSSTSSWRCRCCRRRRSPLTSTVCWPSGQLRRRRPGCRVDADTRRMRRARPCASKVGVASLLGSGGDRVERDDRCDGVDRPGVGRGAGVARRVGGADLDLCAGRRPAPARRSSACRRSRTRRARPAQSSTRTPAWRRCSDPPARCRTQQPERWCRPSSCSSRCRCSRRHRWP